MYMHYNNVQLLYPLLQYFNLPNITIGGYDFRTMDNGTVVPITMTLRQYKRVELNASIFTYSLDGTLDKGIVIYVIIMGLQKNMCMHTVVFEVSRDQNSTDAYKNHSQDPLFNR